MSTSISRLWYLKGHRLLKVIRRISVVSMQSQHSYAQGSFLSEYTSPEWARCLSNVPKYKVQLAMLNTPIHKWNLPGVPDGFEIYIKRDDMTGSTLSGNKVRKLEFIFADALQKGCQHFITCGGIQSNYCRASAIAASQLGLRTHLVLRAGVDHVSEAGCQGNLFINRLCGADMYLVPRSASYKTELLPRMQRIAQRIKENSGEKSYLSPVGGSDDVGFYGYLEGYRELMAQGLHERFDDIIFTTGSGGTAEGLAAGNYLTGSEVKVHGIAVCDNAAIFHEHANETFHDVGLKDVKSEEILDVIDAYKGRGYGIASQEDLDYIQLVAEKTGIILDPTYTGKAVHGLSQELQQNPGRFLGKRLLFIHTGGVFGAFDGRLDSTLLKTGSSSNNITLWNELDQPPF